MGISLIMSGEWVTNCEDLKPNRKDLIEFDRKTYRHWAMYIGLWKHNYDMVVHFNPTAQYEKVGIGWVEGIVTVAKLKDVAGSSRIRVNNLIDESPRTWTDIDEILEKLVDKDGCIYSLTRYNCEHFVTWLRFEVTGGFSCQIAAGLLSKIIPIPFVLASIFPTWYIGTEENGKMQTKQWYEYVKAVEEHRKPRNVIPLIYLQP